MARPRALLVVYLVVVVTLLAGSLHKYGSASDKISAATIAESRLPELLSQTGLFALRCVMLAINLYATMHKLTTSEDKVVLHLPASALPPSVAIHIKGPMWLTFFTVEAWCLQGAYLLGATVCSASTLYGLELPFGEWVPTALWMAFEVSFAVAVLVSFIVKYVLIPGVLGKGQSVDNFFEIDDLLMHNCNVLFMALELLFNDLPITLGHFPLAALWGLTYVVFSWVWLAWKGVCWYDFLDPTLPNACVVHTVLVSVLGVFFAIGAGIGELALIISSPHVRVGIVLAGVATVCKTGILTGVPQPHLKKG